MEPGRQQYLDHYLKKVCRYKVIGEYQGAPVVSLYQAPMATPVGTRSLEMRLKRRFEHQQIPAVATIAINKACQCRCVHCSALYYNHSSKPNLTTAEMIQALQETVELGVTNIILLGGEPLLRPDLFELIQAIPPEKAVVTMFTNGEFLDPDTCKRLKHAGLMGAFVSLDSVRAAEHDECRKRPGLFNKACQGIQNLKKAGLLVAISSYLSPARLEAGVLEEMMDLGKELVVSEVTFFDAIPTGAWLHDTSCLLTSSDRQQIIALVKKYRAQKDFPGISAQATMTCAEGSAFCFAANTQFYLTAHGEMCPCDFTPLTIGKFPEKSIADLWNQMIATPPYNERAKSCRMQDPEFRKKYIQPIPANAELPHVLS